MLSLAAALRASTDAVVDIVDLDFERGLGPVDLSRLVDVPYDIVGISCYSSFEFLKVVALANQLRALLPDAWLVTGGHHPSARPEDFLTTGSAFDYVVVGSGEGPLGRLVRACARGKRPADRILAEEPADPAPRSVRTDWHLLDRYRPVARKLASQAALQLSSGCPSRCAFCAGPAQRCTTWRALEPIEATEELHRLDAYLDLSDWTVFAADAVFGLDRRWRREFLEALARHPVRARKLWVHTRPDAVEREDIALMAAANVAPGFGLESGDPALLATMGKTGDAEQYLEHMIRVAQWATARRVPFGVHVIVGHPGETEASARTTARFLRDLLADGQPTTGLLSVEPFRLYPGTLIDTNLQAWTDTTGMRVHRYPWWHDGDQEFLAQWVDPSRELDYRGALRLRRELFGPLLFEVRRRFGYHGPARDSFERAAREQLERLSPRSMLRTLGLWHLWTTLAAQRDDSEARAAIVQDVELAAAARQARVETLALRGIDAPEPILRALADVPRERFVRVDDVMSSAEDRALALLDGGQATVSAMHSYAKTFEALALREGDHLVDLGGGTGYGAAIAAFVVGREGTVRTVEIDAALSSRAAVNLAHLPNVRVVNADAHDTAAWAGAQKVAVGFALEQIPPGWFEALAPGGVLVAPVGPEGDQRLTRFTREPDGVREDRLGAVRYVPDRSSSAASWRQRPE